MKLLMFAAFEWYSKTSSKIIESEADDFRTIKVENAVIAFIQFEEKDGGENRNTKIKKLVKNIKWLAGKFNYKNVVLHSFTHLSTSVLQHDIAKKMLLEARDRLARTNYNVTVTPFGHLNEFKIHVRGESLGRVFKDL